MKVKRELPASESQPIIRVRFMAFGLAILALVISGPLLLVYKQAYITNMSIKMNETSDSLRILDKEIAALQVKVEQLSSNERIEKFAKDHCGLDFPGVSQMVIVKMKDSENRAASVTMNSVIEVINKSLGVRN